MIAKREFARDGLSSWARRGIVLLAVASLTSCSGGDGPPESSPARPSPVVASPKVNDDDLKHPIISLDEREMDAIYAR